MGPLSSSFALGSMSSQYSAWHFFPLFARQLYTHTHKLIPVAEGAAGAAGCLLPHHSCCMACVGGVQVRAQEPPAEQAMH